VGRKNTAKRTKQQGALRQPPYFEQPMVGLFRRISAYSPRPKMPFVMRFAVNTRVYIGRFAPFPLRRNKTTL
jgi:hypothetical protein